MLGVGETFPDFSLKAVVATDPKAAFARRFRASDVQPCLGTPTLHPMGVWV